MTIDHDQTRSSVQALEVSAFRYSEDPRAMGDFLHVLGLSQRIGNDAGTWLELQAAHGSVSIHATAKAGTAGAESGSTALVLVAQDVPAIAAELTSQSELEVDLWDESFGHQASVQLDDLTIIINEIQPDPYGYQVTEPDPGPVTVITHWHTAALDRAEALLVRLGLQRSARDAGDGAVRLDSGSAGVVVLHRSTQPTDSYRIGIETDDDLEQLAERLEAAGHRPQRAADGSRIDVVDPDGQPIMITTS